MNDGLTIRNLSKTYPSQVALRGVDLEVEAGRVHALLGQNGSGKSTLIKVLAGYHQPDPGASAELNGRAFELGSAHAAHAAGMRFIHQDLGLVPDLDVVDNLALGGTYAGRWWLRNRREKSAARELLAPFGVDVDVSTPLRQLSAAQRTVVAIARALRGRISGAGVLVLDEPTATLPEHEVEMLFAAVRSLCAGGTAVLYVTHRLHEVFALADTVTVLRDGARVMSAPVAEVDSAELITHIAGRPLNLLYPPPPTPAAAIALEATDIEGTEVAGVSLRIHRGEILGVAGISGSGRDELNQLLFGSAPRRSGTISIAQQSYRDLSPRKAIEAGLAYLPADRRSQAAIPVHSVRENVTLPKLGVASLMWLGERRERRVVASWLHRLEVTPAEPERPFATLSGGNQQKAILARWLRCRSQVLLLDEPTQGVDVGGKRSIYDALGAAARDGAAILLASSDVEELAKACDRVLVLRRGRVVAELSGPALTSDAITSHAMHDGDAA